MPSTFTHACPCPCCPAIPCQALWPKVPNLKWLHSASAGLEHLLFPELVEGSVLLTNAKGVYSHSLAEYTLTCCSYFAKDFPRMLAAKAGEPGKQAQPERAVR